MTYHAPTSEPGTGVVIVESTFKSTIYALIIGINTYPNLTQLGGAVNDADEMFNFLTSDLRVPVENITNLRNESASRANIIKGFRDLRDDPRIKKGDPILVFYAGHGGSQQPSDEFKQIYGPSKIQVIFPHDYKVQPPGATEPINCIPDKTIGVLLSDISLAKGDNLTVIFDSCHSASATRVGKRQPRCAEASMEIPADIDMDLLSSTPTAQGHYRRIKSPFTTNQSTHIHFAACGEEEQAFEESGRGVFTVALLKKIRAFGVDKVTYYDLMISLPNLPRQSPHCYGLHASRVLFNSRVRTSRIVFIPVKFQNGALILQAGAASGVTYQSIWELHDSPTEGSQSLGRFCAQAPRVSTVELKPEDPDRDQKPSQPPIGKLYARQVGYGSGNELKVWFSPEAKVAIFESSSINIGAVQPGSSKTEIGYAVHGERESADLTVELGDSVTGEKEVVFHLNDPLAEEYNLATLPDRKPTRRDEVEKVLFAAAKWHWHIHRMPEVAQPRVTIELVKLLRTANDAGGSKVDNNLAAVSTESYEVFDSTTGVVDLVVQPEVPYGIKVNNGLTRPLYLRAFYFSPTKFTIDSMVGSSVSNDRPDPELSARDYTIIGRELGTEITLELDPDVAIELGYIKLFWSTDPFEVNIDQPSPFEEPEVSESEPDREIKWARHLFRSDWGVALLALVQRASSAT